MGESESLNETERPEQWPRRSSRTLVVLCGVVLAGVVLRLYRLGSDSIWLDEAYSHDFARMGVRELLRTVPMVDAHPPLYYLFLHGWISFLGTSEWALRSFSAVVGVLTIPLVFLVGRRLFDDRVGVLAALLFAIAPLHVFQAQNARMYTLLTFLTVASFYAYLRMADGARWATVAYVLSTTLVVYTHVYGVFVPFVQLLYAASCWRSSRDCAFGVTARRFSPALAIVGVLTTPWLLMLGARLLGIGPGTDAVTWLDRPGLVSLPTTYASYLFPPELVLSGVDTTTLVALCALPAVAVTVVALAVHEADAVAGGGERHWNYPSAALRGLVCSDRTRLLVLWVGVPVVLPFVLSLFVVPVFRFRYTIGASVALYVLVAAGLTRIDRSWLRVGCLVVLVLALLAPLPGYYATDDNEQWRESTAYVEAGASSGDLVLVPHANSARPYRYYADRGDLDLTPVAENLSNRSIVDYARHERTVWLVLSHVDPPTEPRFVASLNETHEVAERRAYRNVVVYRFERANRTRTDATRPEPCNRTRSDVTGRERTANASDEHETSDDESKG